ncbi:hypothetical protein DMH12_04450 [Streptomyces sp. WAC 04229]|uniref:hypothetical protein n=1 Tax=Streptomyces sp. WAC 04229 TaxID=2203206 RepID=UPI000F747C6D|nr:hypothetical protein [Streptomyces sp. WAC 04229]RSN64027.1 hypothetical protein DMH12_04450 [Streptomyces sp. WAC 04229]
MTHPQHNPPADRAPRRGRPWLFVLATAIAAAGAFALGGVIRDATDSDASPSACKAALQRAYDKAEAGGDGLKGTPPQCAGISQATVERYIGEIAEQELGEALDDAWGDMGSSEQP